MKDNSEHSIQFQKLSKSHHELLANAIDKGYFKIPRETTLVELADKQGVSDVEASEQLREGIELVVRAYLAETTEQAN